MNYSISELTRKLNSERLAGCRSKAISVRDQGTELSPVPSNHQQPRMRGTEMPTRRAPSNPIRRREEQRHARACPRANRSKELGGGGLQVRKISEIMNMMKILRWALGFR